MMLVLGLYITLGVKVLSSHLPAPDAPNCADDVLRPAHITTARAEQRQRGACFPSMINAVRSSADVRKTSRTRGILLRGQHRQDARTAQAFKDKRASVFASNLGPAGFCFLRAVLALQAFKDQQASSSRVASQEV